MKKLNIVIYNKLLLQAQEAKEQGMIKLASGVFGAIGSVPEDEICTYNFGELKEDIYCGLWKLAGNVIKYHDLDSANAEKVGEVLESLAEKLIDEVEQALGVENEAIGTLEEKLIGQI